MDIAIANFVNSNCLPFLLTRCPKFLKVVAEAKNVGTKYLPPNQNQMSVTLLDGLYVSNYDEMMRTLLLESRIFVNTIYDDSATITNTPLLTFWWLALTIHPRCLRLLIAPAKWQMGVKKMQHTLTVL